MSPFSSEVEASGFVPVASPATVEPALSGAASVATCREGKIGSNMPVLKATRPTAIATSAEFKSKFSDLLAIISIPIHVFGLV